MRNNSEETKKAINAIIKNAISTVIFGSIIIYIACVYIGGNWNPMCWHEIIRTLHITGILSVLYGSISKASQMINNINQAAENELFKEFQEWKQINKKP